MKLRKITLFLFIVFAFIACSAFMLGCHRNEPEPDDKPKALTYSEYMATSDGETVIIEAYITGRRSWWNGAVLYLQDENGGYFVYNLPCSQDEYNTKLLVGNKIRVTGYKTSYAGEVEINGSQAGAEATWELLEGTKTFDAKSVSNLASLSNFPNQLVKLENLVVANVYEEGRNVYFDVTDGANVYTFCVETYMELTPNTSATYTTVHSLEKGDKVTVTGFNYTYYNPQLHTMTVTKLSGNAFDKDNNTLSYNQFIASEDGTTVTISGYIAARYAHWNDTSNPANSNTTLYLVDKDGAYFAYRLLCSAEEYATQLLVGNHIKITGQKSSWKGEVEVVCNQSGAEATWEILEGKFLGTSVDLTALLADKVELAKHNNEYAKFNKKVWLPVGHADWIKLN